MEVVLDYALFFTCLVIVSIILLRVIVKLQKIRKKRQLSKKNFIIGFFHPYCNAGGGGERVLWCAVRALQVKCPNAKCVVYTGDKDASSQDILQKAKHTFDIVFHKDIHFVFLRSRAWVEAKHYPLLTLLGQGIGSLILGLEALVKYPPDIYIDTMGYAFTLPIFKFFGSCQTACYVHYPTISTDMLQVVEKRADTFNNSTIIAKSKVLTQAKLIYYRIFAYMYGLAGRCAESVMVNSSWTSDHIQHLWRKAKATHKVYPPCDISGFLKLPLSRQLHQDFAPHLVLSIGQFRPEKNHTLQVKAFYKFLTTIDDRSKYMLIMAGGCRNKGDEDRVEALRKLANELQLQESVRIMTNISFNQLLELLSVATVGIHTMSNEHFGIGVVEFQAAGVIALAHNSGGPQMDIVETGEGKRSGFLASDECEYAQALQDIFYLTSDQRREIAQAARTSCSRFSEEEFEKSFLASVKSLLEIHEKLD